MAAAMKDQERRFREIESMPWLHTSLPAGLEGDAFPLGIVVDCNSSSQFGFSTLSHTDLIISAARLNRLNQLNWLDFCVLLLVWTMCCLVQQGPWSR